MNKMNIEKERKKEEKEKKKNTNVIILSLRCFSFMNTAAAVSSVLKEVCRTLSLTLNMKMK